MTKVGTDVPESCDLNIPLWVPIDLCQSIHVKQHVYHCNMLLVGPTHYEICHHPFTSLPVSVLKEQLANLSTDYANICL